MYVRVIVEHYLPLFFPVTKGAPESQLRLQVGAEKHHTFFRGRL